MEAIRTALVVTDEEIREARIARERQKAVDGDSWGNRHERRLAAKVERSRMKRARKERERV